MEKIQESAALLNFVIPGMVDTFQKKYGDLQVPYPKDTATADIDKQAVEQKASFEKFVTDSKTRY